VYQAVKDTKTFALQKPFLQEIFHKYPEIGYKIKKDSEKRYRRTLMRPLHAKRMKDLEDYNDK